MRDVLAQLCLNVLQHIVAARFPCTLKPFYVVPARGRARSSLEPGGDFQVRGWYVRAWLAARLFRDSF